MPTRRYGAEWWSDVLELTTADAVTLSNVWREVLTRLPCSFYTTVNMGPQACSKPSMGQAGERAGDSGGQGLDDKEAASECGEGFSWFSSHDP